MFFSLFNIVLIPIITGLVEVFKRAGLPQRLTPLVSLLLGIVGGIFYLCPHDIKSGIIVGLVLGLSASGLYSSTKNIIKR